MKIRVNMVFEHLTCILTAIFLFLSLTISFALGETRGGPLILLTCLIAVFFINILRNRYLLCFRFTLFHVWMPAFFCSCFISAVSASNMPVAISRCIDILEMMVMAFILFICFQREKNMRRLLKTVMWTGYAVVLYAVFYYGWRYILSVFGSGARISNDALNANTLGMCAAYSIVIQIYFMLYEKIRFWNVIMAPAAVVIAASGSRKALMIVILGICLMCILKNFGDKNAKRAMLKALITMLVLAAIFFIVLQFPIFLGVLIRMQKMVNAFLGQGSADSSSLARIRLAEIGMDLFRQSPLIGVGINNPQLYTYSEFGIEGYYLHNNYIELLAGIGILGIVTYYSIYAVISWNMIRYRDFGDGEYVIMLTLLTIRLIMDIGMVSYESKLTYFYLIMFYLEACRMKRKGSGGERSHEFA
ncbi:MAG: O-antigen ligase family protein [Clostridium sp.]|jgi:O-antigen ligase|nr:O-antigen ligase family protein [Clostridium sp.]